MPVVDHRKLGQILIDQGIINAVQLEEALNEQRLTGQFFGEILVGRGITTEEDIAKSLSEQLGFAYVDVAIMEIEPTALKLVSKELCLKLTCIPIFISQNTLTVAMANALDVQAMDKLQETSSLRVRPVFACPSAIRKMLSKHFQEKGEAKTPFPQEAVTTDDETIASKESSNVESVIERVNQIVKKGVELNASDIHLEPEKNTFGCRYRIDGILYQMDPIPFEEQAQVLSRIKIRADMDIAERRLPQDGRFGMLVGSRNIDLRVSTFPSIYGENLVIRILDRSGKLIKLNELGFSKDNLETFIRLIHRPYGMILVTGPTGSGKSTTLYAALSEINSLQKNIITLEDPVEYELLNVRQSQINIKAGLTFASGLRSIVRQDPDIIMIGEIRDKETADISIHAALTGHLVLSTLHTNDAPSAAARLIDMGVEPFLVSSSVIGILAQRLIRTLCSHCRKKIEPSEELLKQLNLEISPKAFYKEVGCTQCKQYGYTGRAGIYEMLIPNENIRSLITRKASASMIAEEAVKSGMKTLRDAGLEKVVHGVTSVSELLRVTEEI